MYGLWFTTTMLAIESTSVISLRMMKIAGGGQGASDEAMLMVQEKLMASIEAGSTLMSGGSVLSVLDRYREHVGANSARLSA